MKQQIEQLIDKLADKTLSFGCKTKDGKVVIAYAPKFNEHLSAPARASYSRPVEASKNQLQSEKAYGKVLIYDGYKHTREVSEEEFLRMNELKGHPILIGAVLDLVSIAWTEEQQQQQWLDLVRLWFECGTTKSLQTIYKEAEWQDDKPQRDDVLWGVVRYNGLVPKDPAIKALFEFLLQLNV